MAPNPKYMPTLKPHKKKVSGKLNMGKYDMQKSALLYKFIGDEVNFKV